MLFQPLPAIQRPLLEKFYKAHRSGMKPRAGAQMWVARDPDIVAALCLTPVGTGHWLTGMFVAPVRRGLGLAHALIEAALGGLEGEVWLFCEPDRLGLYRRSGFAQAWDLPQELADRLARYRQTKPLLALVRPAPRRSVGSAASG
ncbi:GNAT family N-acetyltransferase [Pseudomonas sp. GD03842]|uniref:GNAT family N-acetyltransferase n=1 Tax=unclassified Pseudomonas TaxID=196821 RepID=UPI000D399791|nr:MULTISPECIES: GNAT family N-acetyltransferase [unclassified Pseudomonas]MDH0749648.1 GNAT family N-acetyltransferase [Pseudomonas sp. GD03842]RAU47583.1 N-acetyltransferase [Pseudomonas sp. RIT 409]RAU49025.1 N-acetyltransferase [Pseudomonas sp. RIT 412]